MLLTNSRHSDMLNILSGLANEFEVILLKLKSDSLHFEINPSRNKPIGYIRNSYRVFRKQARRRNNSQATISLLVPVHPCRLKWHSIYALSPSFRLLRLSILTFFLYKIGPPQTSPKSLFATALYPN